MSLPVNSDVVEDMPSNNRRNQNRAADIERMGAGLANIQPKTKPQIEGCEEQEYPPATTLDLARDEWLKPSAKKMRKQESTNEEPRAGAERDGDTARKDCEPTDNHVRGKFHAHSRLGFRNARQRKHGRGCLGNNPTGGKNCAQEFRVTMFSGSPPRLTLEAVPWGGCGAAGPGAKAIYKETARKQPGEFDRACRAEAGSVGGLVQPPVALRLRAFTLSSCSTSRRAPLKATLGVSPTWRIGEVESGICWGFRR